MAIPKILLFYAFTPLADPVAIQVWQRDLAESLGLRGRILLSRDGINGTLGGEIRQVKRYLRRTRDHPAFTNLDVKWSDGTGLDASGRSVDFPRLSVRVRDEIVSFGAPSELRVGDGGVIGGGTRLSPTALHELVTERGDDVVFFDGRNAIEAEIGRFRGALVPDVANTRDFVAELDSGKYDSLKGRAVVTYCTGGIRCEVLSSLMINRGFSEVYQLDGGIIRYGETFGDRGLWEGSLYVFDRRGAIEFSPEATMIGRCVSCGIPSSSVHNCVDPSCRALFVSCSEHAGSVRCTEHALAAGQVAH